jgi:membrane protein
MIASGYGWVRSFFPNLRDAGIRWSEDDAGSLAASVAYYLALSLFPMMLLLTSGCGMFLQFSNRGKDAEQQILAILETNVSPVVKEQIEQVLHQLQKQSIVSGPFGFIAASLAAIGIFAQIDKGFDKIFRIPPQKEANMRRTIYRVIKNRFFAFVMLVCLGGMILVLFATSMILAQITSITNSNLPSLHHLFGVFQLGFTVLANAMLFTLVYRWLPKRVVRWPEAIRGGLLAACIWELGREVLGAFLIGMRYTSAYGAIGSFIAILLWCYYGISILFFGAEYVQVLQLRRKGLSTTGDVIPLSTTSSRLSLEKAGHSRRAEPDILASSEYEVQDSIRDISDGHMPELVESQRALFVPHANLERQRPRRSDTN